MKDKGFSMIAVLAFLTLAIAMIHTMAANQLSTLKYRKKKIERIHKQIDHFNKLVIKAKNEKH